MVRERERKQKWSKCCYANKLWSKTECVFEFIISILTFIKLNNTVKTAS